MRTTYSASTSSAQVMSSSRLRHTKCIGSATCLSKCTRRSSKPQRLRTHVTRASLESIPHRTTEQCLNHFHLYGKYTNNKCREAVQMYYEEVWNNSNLDMLEELIVEDVVYAEKNIYDEDFTGRKRLRKIIAEYQRAYPNFRFSVDKIICDEDCQSAMAHWTAQGSCLGQRMNYPASGKTSQVSGMTMFSFDCHGLMYEIVNFRTQLAEEASVSQIDWE